MSIEYSDGVAVESRIGKLLQEETRLRSEVRIGAEHYDNWPTRYHLSPERSNLLRHLTFDGMDVLELGAGMGGVSRYLAENAKTLTVVEGTQPRFDALSARLRDLKNWSGTVANIQDLRLDSTFDVVCLIGVLEYAEVYVKPATGSGESPFSWTLKLASGLVKDDGVLLVAIENRLGIKYWSGAAEDHLGTLFDGICGYPSGCSPKTFSRMELLRLLHDTEFRVVDEYYPFPDYKMPSCVITPRLGELAPSMAAGLAVNERYENYEAPRVNFFPDILAVGSVAKAGLLGEFSNSFLFLGSRTAESVVRRRLLRRQLEDHEIGWHYSSFVRKVPTRTVFVESQRGDAGIEVRKMAALRGCPDDRQTFSEGTFAVIWKPCPVMLNSEGDEVRLILANRAYFNDWSGFKDMLRSFLKWSFDRWSVPGERSMLSGDSLDAIFLNACALRGNDFSLFDSEWAFGAALPKSWFILRNVAALGKDLNLLSSAASFRSLRDLYDKLCLDSGVVPAYEADLDREARFQQLVTEDGTLEEHRVGLNQLLGTRFRPSPFPRTPAAEYELRLRAFRPQLCERIARRLRASIRKVPVFYRLIRRVRS